MLRQSLKVALVQLSVGANKSKNIAEAVKFIHRAKDKGAQLVVLPEFIHLPYGPEYPFAESSRMLSEAAASSNICVVGGTLPERCGDKVYNTCTVWDHTGALIAKYRKTHLFDVDIPNKLSLQESSMLSAGDSITTFDYLGVRFGLGVCYDLRFYELSHLMTQRGCSFLIYPSAFNMTTGPMHWEVLARARAIDHQLWVALVSPATDMASKYVAWGHTILVDPWGRVVEQMDEKEGMIVADIDMQTVEDFRKQMPIRHHRRKDIYDTIHVNTYE